MDAAYLRAEHEAGLTYDAYLQTATDRQRADWQQVYDQVRLTDSQQQLLASFYRNMKVITLSGIWCGDCVQQGPLVQRIAEAAGDTIDLRWLNRDAHPELQAKVAINAGHRVPVVVFCAEDFEPLGWFGDRTLSRYRAMAERQLVGACPLPGAAMDDNELADTLQDWVDQFERMQLILRLSARLKKKYDD